MQVTSGDKDSLRPGSPQPLETDDRPLQEIVLTVSETDEPTYVENVVFVNLNNADELQIRVVKTPGGAPELVDTVMVSLQFLVGRLFGVSIFQFYYRCLFVLKLLFVADYLFVVVAIRNCFGNQMSNLC